MQKSSLVKRVCVIPKVRGVGGMVSFRSKLVQGLSVRGIGVADSLFDTPYEAVLVIGGTRDLAGLWRAKRGGVRVVQRLDGMNWIHRRTHTGWHHYLRAEYGNLILSVIRRHLADAIVYQSEFSQLWWERVYGAIRAPWKTVHNGVDLTRYTPQGAGEIPADHIRLLLVEGTIGGGYEFGLKTAIQVAEQLKSSSKQQVEVRVVGRISEGLQETWKSKTNLQLSFTGQVPAEQIPEMDRSAHILYASDLNPACPNSVIEALACGLPVAGYHTGALGEIVTDGSGEVVPYGGDPWNLDPPDIAGLAGAAQHILNNLADYRRAARRRAEAGFSLDRMVDGYLEALEVC